MNLLIELIGEIGRVALSVSESAPRQRREKFHSLLGAAFVGLVGALACIALVLVLRHWGLL